MLVPIWTEHKCSSWLCPKHYITKPAGTVTMTIEASFYNPGTSISKWISSIILNHIAVNQWCENEDLGLAYKTLCRSLPEHTHIHTDLLTIAHATSCTCPAHVCFSAIRNNLVFSQMFLYFKLVYSWCHMHTDARIQVHMLSLRSLAPIFIRFILRNQKHL